MVSTPMVWVVVVVGAAGFLALTASMLAVVIAAVVVVLRYSRQCSFPLELMLRQRSAASAWDYGIQAASDAAASGRCEGQPGTPPSSASDEGKPQQDAVPLSDTVDMAGFDPTQGRL